MNWISWLKQAGKQPLSNWQRFTLLALVIMLTCIGQGFKQKQTTALNIPLEENSMPKETTSKETIEPLSISENDETKNLESVENKSVSKTQSIRELPSSISDRGKPANWEDFDRDQEEEEISSLEIKNKTDTISNKNLKIQPTKNTLNSSSSWQKSLNKQRTLRESERERDQKMAVLPIVSNQQKTSSQQPKTTIASQWKYASFPVENFQGYSSPFGYRISPVDGKWQFHSGLDFAAPIGSYVRNWWSGRVVEVSDNTACGTSIAVQSGKWRHTYCHLNGYVQQTSQGLYLVDRDGGIQIKEGQDIPAGMRIGRVGMTGRTTGPHLHWSLKYDDRAIDPALVLRQMFQNKTSANALS